MINVSKVPCRDWSLYFNNVYMRYNDEICKVVPDVVNNRTSLVLYPEEGERIVLWRKNDLKNLHVWWPRPGAYNGGGRAAYIARKATRCMRKSCCPSSHYYIKWGNCGIRAVNYLRAGPNHISWEDAKEALDAGTRKSVAVCRDMIVTRVKDGYGIVYRGEEAGAVKGGEYIPMNEFSPITKLVLHRLLEEGIV